MRADLLHVITPVSNPLRWKSRTNRFHDFARHMIESGVQLHVVDCVLRERPHELNVHPGVNHIAVHHETLCWHKESLINIALSRLPRSAEYIAWIDADIRFRNPNWAADTVHALQQYAVVQLWEHCYDLGPQQDHMFVHSSFGSLWVKGKPIHARWSPKYEHAHPGYGWSCRREVISGIGGLLDFAVLGSADSNMAMAFIGRAGETFRWDISNNFTAAMKAWQDRAQHYVGRRVGYVPGTIEHYFHGSKVSRNYVNRWDILRKHHFNPTIDMFRNMHGVVELAETKPLLRHEIEAYFSARNEDANTV